MTKPETIGKELEKLIVNFENKLKSNSLRQQVLSLVPCFHELRRLGKSLIPRDVARSARDRILHYFQRYPHIAGDGDELLVVSGIREYARRVREPEVQFGRLIVNGPTAGEMTEEGEFPLEHVDLSKMKPSDYIGADVVQDRDAAHRWFLTNEIRKENLSVRDKILKYFLKNVGKQISGEELRYVARDKSEWAGRVGELRTEFGWPIVTKNTGRPDPAIGIYVLEANRQRPEHDRHIPDAVKRGVLRRDGYKCQTCGWTHDQWNRSDPGIWNCIM